MSGPDGMQLMFSAPTCLPHLSCAVAISIQVSFVDSPLPWYGAQIAVATVASVLVVLDYFVIRSKIFESSRDAERSKLRVALKHQVLRLAALVAALPFAIVCWLLLYYLPDAMLGQRWHLLLVCLGIVAFTIVTMAEYFFFRELREPLLRAVSEAIEEADVGDRNRSGAESAALDAQDDGDPWLT